MGSQSHKPKPLSEEDDRTVISPQAPLQSLIGSDQAYIIVLAGGNVGEMYKLDKPLVMGRTQAADVRIIDDGISRVHAKLEVDQNGAFVEDLGSTNGTYVNGTAISGKRLLQDGDKIQLGSTTILKFTYHDHLDQQFQQQMYESALRDGLTKIFNRRYFLDRLATEYAYMQRHHTQLSLLMFDIDHFKRINDTYGHLAGDYVLTTLAQGVSRSIRAEDVFARFGGEEFVLLCRGIDLAASKGFAERVCKAIATYKFKREGVQIPVTISIGVAIAPTPRASTPQDLIDLADKALYRAKEGGRNRVAVAEE